MQENKEKVDETENQVKILSRFHSQLILLLL